MDKKLPEIFHNKIDKKLNNNKNIFYSSKISEPETREEPTPMNIHQKINQIFSSPNYVYKADVEIKTKEQTITTKIIGRNRNYLITMDNQLISITDIIDITKKTN